MVPRVSNGNSNIKWTLKLDEEGYPNSPYSADVMECPPNGLWRSDKLRDFLPMSPNKVVSGRRFDSEFRRR